MRKSFPDFNTLLLVTAKHMKRRTFIYLSAAGVLATSLPLSCSKLSRAEYDPLLAQPQSLSALIDYDQITIIGNKYIEKKSNEANVRSLVEQLMHGISDKGIKLADAIQTKVKSEFEKRNTVMVDGWVLSVTEARQCALSSLTNLP